MPDRRDKLGARLAALGEPLALGDELRRRLEAALVASSGADVEVNPLAGFDRPLALPAGLEQRLTDQLVLRAARTTGWRGRAVPVLGLAAAVVLVLASVAVINHGSSTDRRRPSVAAGQPSAGRGSTANEVTSTTAGAIAALPAPASGGAAGASGGPQAAAGSAAGSSAGAASSARATGSGPAPPYSFGTGDPGARAATAASLRVGVIGGNAAEQAGLRAYVDLLNRSGGAGGHPFDLVPSSPSAPAAGTVATVNLSSAQVASAAGPPSWVSGALLETLPVASGVLSGRVFDLSSAAERQAHLLVDAVYPSNAPGATAAVYQVGSGVLGAEVPQALDDVLRSRQVTPVHIVVAAGKPTTLVAADAAFLSLDTSTAAGWLNEAKASTYAPARGVAGIYSLLDASLLPSLRDGTRVLSPYLLPSGAESAAMAAGTHDGPSDAVSHGWVTAKALAVAIWQSGAATGDEVVAALQRLQGFDDALAPPYQTRSGTNARIPDGVLYTVTSGRFVQHGEFRTDPR